MYYAEIRPLPLYDTIVQVATNLEGLHRALRRARSVRYTHCATWDKVNNEYLLIVHLSHARNFDRMRQFVADCVTTENLLATVTIPEAL